MLISTAATCKKEPGHRGIGESERKRPTFSGSGLNVSAAPVLRFSGSARPNSRTASAGAGFTLLELAVVLFIIGLLVAAMAPRLGDVSGARLEATAKRLAAVVRYVSGEAALRNQPYRLNYDLDKQRYWVTKLVVTQESAEFRNDLTPLSRPVQLPSTITFADVQAPGVGRISMGQVYTHFLPHGYADPTIIHLRDQRSHTVTVLIPPLTGEARIYEGYVDGFSLEAKDQR
ncbi:MAG TPA: prepilin-type N-terminal cleavage/methylation domain-containing protein [Methylomirabilota bacterium]|nr:prepilin-type N-terminal cleavage/methylation domain-containing protein [Methylomirabilota bacterium]